MYAITLQTQNIFITLVQRLPNVFDFRPTLYKYDTNVLCLLGNYFLHETLNLIRVRGIFRYVFLSRVGVFHALC